MRYLIKAWPCSLIDISCFLTELILCLYFHSARMTSVLLFVSSSFFAANRWFSRSSNKCPTKRGRQSTLCRRNFRAYSALLCPYFMEEGCWIVRWTCRGLFFPSENSTTVCFVCCVDNLGLMPYRKRIVAVSTFLVFPFLFILSFFDGWLDLVGRPIHVEQSDKPTLEELTRIQKLYIDELTRWVLAKPSLH